MPGVSLHSMSLRKHAHVIYSVFHGCKMDNFQMKKCDVYLIFVQTLIVGTR